DTMATGHAERELFEGVGEVQKVCLARVINWRLDIECSREEGAVDTFVVHLVVYSKGPRSIGDCVTVLDALQKPSSGGVSRLASAPSLPSVSPSKS
ncbi:hypothetical protein TGCOUG_203688, partial [Toxoplasma gondii COUG]